MRDSLITILSSCIVAAMRKTILLLALASVALTVQGATISTPAIQDVRLPAVPTDLVIPPKVLWHPPAVYNDEARQRGIEGTVVVQAQFDEQGNFTVLKVVKGLGYGLDEAALEALKGWRFSPALQNGVPVTAVSEIEIPFHDPRRIARELARRLEESQKIRQEILKKQQTPSQ